MKYLFFFLWVCMIELDQYMHMVWLSSSRPSGWGWSRCRGPALRQVLRWRRNALEQRLIHRRPAGQELFIHGVGYERGDSDYLLTNDKVPCMAEVASKILAPPRMYLSEPSSLFFRLFLPLRCKCKSRCRHTTGRTGWWTEPPRS